MLNEQLKKNVEKQAIHVLKITGDLKDSVITTYLNELTKSIKTQAKRKNLVVYVVEEK
jgi:hypothetical protein